MALKMLAVVLVSGAAVHATANCTNTSDCNLNGDCVDGSCKCDAAWSSSPDCSVISFEKVEKAAGKAPGYYNTTEASWGGYPIQADDGKWHLLHAQFRNQCPLSSWKTNSAVVHSTASSALGPYTYVDEALPPFAHNPSSLHLAPDGTYVFFYIGGWATNVSTCPSRAFINAEQQSTAPLCTARHWPKSCGPNMPGPRGDCCGDEADGLNGGCGISIATAKSISGPWTTQPIKIEDQWLSDDVYCTHTNPSVQYLSNGTAVMAFNAGQQWLQRVY